MQNDISEIHPFTSNDILALFDSIQAFQHVGSNNVTSPLTMFNGKCISNTL